MQELRFLEGSPDFPVQKFNLKHKQLDFCVWYATVYHMKGVKEMTGTAQERIAIIAQYQQGVSAQKLSAQYGVCERTIYC